MIDATLQLLESAKALRHGARVRLHAGTVERLGRVSLSGIIEDETPGGDGEAALSRATEIPPGGRAHVRIRLESQVAATRGDRFILRAYSPSVTIAGGVVLDPAPSRGAIRTAAGRARFAAIDVRGREGEDEGFVEQVVVERGAQGLERATLIGRAGLEPSRVADVVARLSAAGRVSPLGTLLVPSGVLDTLSDRLLETVRAYHEQQPLSEGLPREEARSRVFARAHAAVFERVVADLVAGKRLAGADRLALAGRPSSLSDADRRAMTVVEQAFERAGLMPPDRVALAAALTLAPAQVEAALTLLVRQKVLVRLDTLMFHASALERLKSEVRALRGSPAGQRLDVAAIKDGYGVSRKFAIPLLEYLDRERVTRRTGDARVVL